MTEPLPPKEYKPEFMEKYTSFISKYDWKDIMKICADRLEELGCECKTEKFSLHCTFYNEQWCVCIPFHVNIFTSASSNEYVVEFQKRCSGDTVEFMELYANFIQQDKGCGMVVQSKTFFTPRQTPNLVPELDQDALECLTYHLKSDYFDVRSESLVMLAICVQTEANRILMYHTPSFLSILSSLLDVDYDRFLYRQRHKITYPTLIILKFLLKSKVHKETLTVEALQQLSSKLEGLLGKNLGHPYNNLINAVLISLEKRSL